MSKPTLNDAIAFAAQRHFGQVDKAGENYILHPLRVMQYVHQRWGYDEHLLMAAVLHDVKEDCNVTDDDLRRLGYPEEVIVAVDFLSKRPEEEGGDTDEEKDRRYFLAIARIASGPLTARRCKVCDLKDNTDPSRATGDHAKQAKRNAKYYKAIEILEPLCNK